MTSIEREDGSVRARLLSASVRPLLLLWVFLGGALGTAARAGVAFAMPPDQGVPWAILTVNVVGAFLLGALLAAVGRRASGPSEGRTVRLFVGTGVLGGFTTYSAFATDTVLLFETDAALAVACALGGVVAGVVAAWAGLRLAAWVVPVPKKVHG